MNTTFCPPVHNPPRSSEAPEGEPHRFLVKLRGFFRWDTPEYGSRWTYYVYDMQYEQGTRVCMARGEYHSDHDALQAAEQYCGEGNGLIRYQYSTEGVLRQLRRSAGLPA